MNGSSESKERSAGILISNASVHILFVLLYLFYLVFGLRDA
jgi:hypothetical protein